MYALGFLLPSAIALTLTSTLLFMRRGGSGLPQGVLLTVALITAIQLFSALSPTLNALGEAGLRIFPRIKPF